jgi:hypothetical protein
MNRLMTTQIATRVLPGIRIKVDGLSMIWVDDVCRWEAKGSAFQMVGLQEGEEAGPTR